MSSISYNLKNKFITIFLKTIKNQNCKSETTLQDKILCNVNIKLHVYEIKSTCNVSMNLVLKQNDIETSN